MFDVKGLYEYIKKLDKNIDVDISVWSLYYKGKTQKKCSITINRFFKLYYCKGAKPTSKQIHACSASSDINDLDLLVYTTDFINKYAYQILDIIPKYKIK